MLKVFSMRDDVADMVDKFINASLEQNPEAVGAVARRGSPDLPPPATPRTMQPVDVL